MPSVLITGLSGQDGSYLAEQLLDEGYDVHGIIRGGRLGSAAHLADRVIAYDGDLRDAASLRAAVDASAPDAVYHLGSVTHVADAQLDPGGVTDVVVGGTKRLLDAVLASAPSARVFCASSAEIFGAPAAAPQDEQTPLRPRNVYGEAKAAALELVRRYRAERGLWIAAGILFNHESPRRPLSFVTRKVTWHAAAIAHGRARELRIGSLDTRRDWGYAPEYVDGARRALQADAPEDFVFATGQLHTIGELVETAFKRAGVSVDRHVVVDPAFSRPAEPVPLVGDPSKASRLLGWQASVPFEDVIAEMVDADLETLSR